MGRTYFQGFKRDDGTPITVEYSITAGSETTYSPLNGACGGDACEVEIVKAFTNTEDVQLSDAEGERFCDWIAEHHVFDDEGPDDYEF